MIRIKDFIRRVGIADQSELAGRLGVTSNTVSMWANGKRCPTYETCLTLLRMGMTVEELFGEPFPSSAKDAEPRGEMERLVKEALRKAIDNIGI